MKFPRVFLCRSLWIEESIERSIIQSCDDIGISGLAVWVRDMQLPLFILSRSELRAKSAPRKLQTLVGMWTSHGDGFRVKFAIFQKIEISRHRITQIVLLLPLEGLGKSIFDCQ